MDSDKNTHDELTEVVDVPLPKEGEVIENPTSKESDNVKQKEKLDGKNPGSKSNSNQQFEIPLVEEIQ